MTKKHSYPEIFSEEEKIVEKPVTITTPQPIYKVKVTHPSLRIRQAPNTEAQVLGLITDQGEYGIFKADNGWGQLEDGSWIMLSFTKKI